MHEGLLDPSRVKNSLTIARALLVCCACWRVELSCGKERSVVKLCHSTNVEYQRCMLLCGRLHASSYLKVLSPSRLRLCGQHTCQRACTSMAQGGPAAPGAEFLPLAAAVHARLCVFPLQVLPSFAHARYESESAAQQPAFGSCTQTCGRVSQHEALAVCREAGALHSGRRGSRRHQRRRPGDVHHPAAAQAGV